MARRTFAIQHRVSNNVGGGVIDVPHLSLLKYADPPQIVREFTEAWGVPPKAVVLPVALPDGLLYDIPGLAAQQSRHMPISPQLKEFGDLVKLFAQTGLDIYLLINPRLGFIKADPLHIIDITGDSSAALCFGNPRSRDLIAAVLGSGLDIALEATKGLKGRIAGVVLDLVDLWPMGANDQRLELTCFCPSCENWFESVQPGLLDNFKTFPSPWNLLLKDSGSGISFIDEIRTRSTEDNIIGLSRQKGYIDVFSDMPNAQLLEQAKYLLQYIAARHDQTVLAAEEIFRQSLDNIDPSVGRILLVEGAYYGWTSGIWLERLDVCNDVRAPYSYSEVWFDPSSTDLVLRNVPFRSYMWRRSRYYIDSFFEFADNVEDPGKRAITGIAKLSKQRAHDLLKLRLGQTLATAMTGQVSLASLPELASEKGESKRLGFVAASLTPAVGKKLLEAINVQDGLSEDNDDNN